MDSLRFTDMPYTERLKWALRYAENERKAYEVQCGKLQSEVDMLRYELDTVLAMSNEDLKEYKKSAFYIERHNEYVKLMKRHAEAKKTIDRLLSLQTK